MKITNLVLTDFNLVKDSGISHLAIAFSELVQLIIGTNGSGKSSCLRQLSPFPASRSLFGKKGIKSLTIEKDGIIYRLDADYAKPSAPHQFFEGDSEENLNQGGTTETQKELIVEHLGITPFIDDLVMNRFDFPKWTPTRRKEFLMAHNPDDIGFVMLLAKQKASEIRACKNNIARLQSRKILLEQDLLSPDDVEALDKEKERITTDLGNLQQLLMDLEVGLRTIGGEKNVGLYEVRAIKKTLQNIRYSLHRYSHIDRDDHRRIQLRDKLVGGLASTKDQLTQIDEDIVSQTNELSELEIRYRELAPDGDLMEVEATILRLENERDRLQIPTPHFQVSREELNRLYVSWETIRETLLVFQDCTIPLYSRKKRSIRERQLELAKYRQSSYQMKLSDLRNQYDDVARRNTLSPRDIPDAPCAKNACPLYAHFMEDYSTMETKRQKIQKGIAVINSRLTRLDTYISECSDYFERSKHYHDRIAWIVTQSQTNPILHAVLRNLDILSTLSSHPSTISRRLKDEYDHIDQWLKLKGVLSDLETAYTLKSQFVGSQDHDTVKLVVSIENLRKSLYGLRKKITDISEQRNRIQKHLIDISEYESLKSTVLTIQETHLEYTRAIADNHETDKLIWLKRSIEAVRSQLFVRLSEVERTLRAQSGLSERYQEEVLNELGKIEKERSDLEQIEKALVVIPRENTIAFVNSVFDQANRLIDSVWTVPFQIELLKPDAHLNYEFMVSGDNQSLREMSECSEGQTEILSLAINLALRIQLGHLSFPLCLDEPARTFDSKHEQNLVRLLKRLLDDGMISQLFVVSHQASMHEGFEKSETFVIRDDNILTPEFYNSHVVSR